MLPFNIDQVLDNLRYERYAMPGGSWLHADWAREVYYALRPYLPRAFRKHLQRIYLKDRQGQEFPSWPVDRSVDLLSEQMMMLALKSTGIERIPFIWFWPEGHRACAIVTHDVETRVGQQHLEELMDIDEQFGIKASVQIVPEKRYTVSGDFLHTIRSRGFEINVHGLDHDGNLFHDRKSFLERANRINMYAAAFNSRGFRSTSMYRNAEWFRHLNFSYDMSVPNVSRLEPQQGGCCTVMPYFLPGGMLELPLTTTQDYSLFFVLNDYSVSLWKQQMDGIAEGHGFISFIVHPDYVCSSRAQRVYRELLEQLVRRKTEDGIWLTIAGEVDRWWRQRSAMKLISSGNSWRIDGPGSDRARLAYAYLDGDKLAYDVPV
jgi:hypothetical protein